MAKIDRLTEQKIKDAANIVDVVGDFVALRRTGVNYKGVCPFHDDHSPSMSVSPKRNIFKCFVCGKGGNAVDFLMEHPDARLSYPDTLRYLAKKYSIWIDDAGQDSDRWQHVKPAKPRDVADVKPLEMLTIDRGIVKRTTDLRDHNTFVRWLRSLPWTDEQRARVEPTLWSYCVGHFRKDTRTVWWQIDDQGRVHTGKLMMYQDNGKRNRDKWDHPGWAHNYLPYDCDRYGMQQCLFGLHLVDRYKDVPVNIVESEKTAVVCAIAYGMERGLWLACGGLQNMKESELQPLIDRHRTIYLWPDRDGQDDWQLFADSIQYADLHIWARFLTDNWIEADGPKADIADIILRHIQHPETIKMSTGDGQGVTPTPTPEDNEPFLDSEELTDPRIREWRQKLRDSHNPKWPRCDVAGVKTVGEILIEHPIIKKLIDNGKPTD